MKDYIDSMNYYGFTARLKRLSDTLNSEARNIYAHLAYEIEPNWHLVFLMLKEEPLTVTEIAKQLQFSHPAIIKITQKMKTLDYIQSHQDAEDSRKQLLSLTPKSEQMLPRFEKEWERIQMIVKDCADDNFLASIQYFEQNLKDKSIFERFKNDHNREAMSIAPSNLNDLSTILKFYAIATAYMESKNQVAWPVFPKDMIIQEIEEQRQWKLMIENQIACIWATTLNDELIWGNDSKEPSVYIHRIATNPNFRGQNLVKKLIAWANTYGKEHQLKYIRMDTVGLNHGLIGHYEKLGFEFLGAKQLDNTNGLPDHYKEGDVCLFQKEIK